jgi:DNA (cytosine-5)-methyltransferase 1
MSMNELALFAGAGGGLLASELLGWRTICAVELSEYRRNVLSARQNDRSLPPFPVWDDVRTFDGTAWRGRVDVVSGGFPCQAYSSATRGRPTAAELWPHMRRIVHEVAPRYVFAENVSAAAIDWAADDLQAMGYKVRCVALSARDLGYDHVRKRYWLRAHTDDESQLPCSVDAEMAIVQSLQKSFRAGASFDPRISDGVADWVERLEATGDGQIPIVAATAWRLMTTANPEGDK